MWLVGVMVTVAISLSSFTLYWIFQANARLEKLADDINDFNELDDKVNFQELKTNIEHFLNDTSKDESQNRQLQKHWKLHSWERDQINALRHSTSLPPATWPDLDE